ncbi:hypothetical protein [Orientia tsutsugamushi]|nr:hypothetical protein [Orientia tsutsugamushi]
MPSISLKLTNMLLRKIKIPNEGTSIIIRPLSKLVKVVQNYKCQRSN